jgi:hypothetical protein
VAIKAKVTGQPVKLGNDELCFLLLAGRKRLLQFGPVAAFSALNLGELANQLGIAVDEGQDGGALRPRGAALHDRAGMGDASEVVREVGINDFRVAMVQQHSHLDHRLSTVAAFHAEHVAVIEQEAQTIDAIMHVIGVANVDANVWIVDEGRSTIREIR